MLLLYPLLLQAYKNVPYQPWLRGAIDGITPGQCRNLMSFRDLFRRGVLTHVVLHSRLEARYADRRRDVKRELRSAGFGKELIRANVNRLEKLVRSLEWKPGASEWSQYGRAAPRETDAEEKARFVREAVGQRARNLVWDLGANDGYYSRITAESARYVVAVDTDHAVVERLYRALKEDGETTVLPLVMNVVDASPGLGWRGLERKAFDERGRPDLTLALALIHHVAITANVPIREFLGWLAALGTPLVIEFPTRDDAMVKRLLAAKREGLHADYDRDAFERSLEEVFTIERSQALPSGTRFLYFAHPKR
jgi:hypothetical protein